MWFDFCSGRGGEHPRRVLGSYSGTLVTETVFAVPGVGRLMLEAIFARDYPLIQGLTLTFALLVSVVFLLTDLVQSMLDPRMRLT